MNKIKKNVDEKLQYKYFLLTFDDNYVKVGGGLIASIVKNTNQKICFIVFTEGLKSESINLLADYKVPIIIYTLNNYIDFKEYFKNRKWPVISIARIFAPFIIEEDTDYLYYLDCDMLCINNIDALFKLTFNEAIAICPEVSGNIHRQCDLFGNDDLYCNSGFIIFNVLKVKTQYNMTLLISNLKEIIDNLKFPDQDFINIYFKNDCKLLNPVKYNNQIYEYIKFKKASVVLKNCLFIHFSAGKPWSVYCPIKIARIYKKYVCNVEIRSDVNKALLKHYIFCLPIFCIKVFRKLTYKEN